MYSDNIFVYKTRLSSYSTSLIVNGLPNHYVPSLTTNNTAVPTNKIPSTQKTIKINTETITPFQLQVKNEQGSLFREK
jgi:hypothetical protein